MTQEQKKKFFESITAGIADGLPVVSQVRAAIRSANTTTAPRLLVSLTTLAAVVVVFIKWTTGAMTASEVLEALSRLLPTL